MSRSAHVLDHFNQPRNAGSIEHPTATGRADLHGSRPIVEVTIRVERGMVEEVGFQARGCGYLIAACSAATELIKHQPVQRCEALTAKEVEEALGGLPAHKRYLAELAVSAICQAAEGATNVD